MLNENEIIMLVLGIGILFLVFTYRPKIKRIYGFKILLVAFYLLIASWTFTVLEDLFLYNLLNLLEHLCFAASAVVMLYWCWKAVSVLRGEAVK